MNDPNKVLRGSLRQVARANGKRAWEWRYVNPTTGLYESKYFSGQEFPTEQDIEEHLKPFRLRLNFGQTEKVIVDPTFGDLLDAYIAEENLIEIKSRRPGDRTAGKDELAFSTATSYLSLSNMLRVRWGSLGLNQFKPLGFQKWLKSLDVKPKTKGHLKAFVHRLFNKAKLYSMVDFHENPIALVEVRGISKRSRKPVDLTIDQFFLILRLVPKSYQDMILVDQCTGLRAGELLALRWEAVDFERLCIKVKEGVVNGRIGPVKTEYSEDELPLDPDFATVLLRSNGSRRGPACCSLVPPPDVLTMLLRSSRTTSAARDGVLLCVLAVVRLPGRHAPKGIRSVERVLPSRSMTNVANLQLKIVTVASDGTPFGTPIEPCSAAPIPDRRSAKTASSRPHLDHAAVRRSADGEPAAGEQQGREKTTLS